MKTFFPKVIFFQIIFRLSLFYNDYCQKSQNVILHQKKQRQYNAKQIITTLDLPKYNNKHGIEFEQGFFFT